MHTCILERIMKNITISLNEDEYQSFREKAENDELSDYALVKRIVLEYLNDNLPSNSDDVARPYVKKVKMLKHQQKWALATIFVLSCYFVVSLVYICCFRV